MDILIGSVGTLGFLLCLATAYYLGRRQRKTDIVNKLTEQEERELQRRMKGVENVMNYDYDVALGRRVDN